MYFSEDQTSGNDQNNALPQFSELRSTLSAGSLDYTNDGNMQMQATDTTFAYTIGLSQKQVTFQIWCVYDRCLLRENNLCNKCNKFF